MPPDVILPPFAATSGAPGIRRSAFSRFAALRYENFGLLPLMSDVVSILAAATMGGAAYDATMQRELDIKQYLIIGVALIASFVPFAKLNKLYSLRCLLAAHHVRQLISSWSLSCLMLTALLFASRQSDVVPRGLEFFILLTAIVSMALCRVFAAAYARLALERGWLKTVKIILIGSTSSIERNRLMLTSVGFAVVEELKFDGANPVDSIEAVIRHARALDIDEIHVAVDDDRAAVVSQVVARLRSLPITIRWIPTPELAGFLAQPISLLASRPSFKIHRPPLSEIERSIKRVFDVTAALVMLLVLAPALALLAILIKIDTPGPAFFIQRRRGFNGRPFLIYKFRTMFTLEDGEIIKQAVRDDVRVTRMGRWLRRTSIDELPQLLNVLRGDMSLVGPRPHAVAHDDEYTSKISRYANRHHVKPGITGWAQINGARGETVSTKIMMRRVKLDLWYISNWSILLDIWIVVRTSGMMFKNKDVY